MKNSNITETIILTIFLADVACKGSSAANIADENIIHTRIIFPNTE